jgi:hypothetical protein
MSGRLQLRFAKPMVEAYLHVFAEEQRTRVLDR